MIGIDLHQLESEIDAAKRRLGRFRDRVIKKALRAATTQANREYRTASRQLVPTINRYLKRSLQSKIKTYPSGAVLGVIGQDMRRVRRGGTKANKRGSRGGGITGRGETVPSHLVESPTRPHRIRPRGQALRWQWGRRKGQVFFRPGSFHRGTRGARFLGRAAHRAQPAAQQAYETRIIAEANRA